MHISNMKSYKVKEGKKKKKDPKKYIHYCLGLVTEHHTSFIPNVLFVKLLAGLCLKSNDMSQLFKNK